MAENAASKYTFILTTKQMLEFWGSAFVIMDIDIVLTSDHHAKIGHITFPVMVGKKSSKQYKGRFPSAYYTAGWYAGKYFSKNLLK
ncbi:MAG: hypothetical protein WCK34_08860 [Bacteroidota bacterium]